MLPKVVKHNGDHELFMNTYGRRRSTVLLASERSERYTIRGVQIRACAVYIYIYIYMYGGTYAIFWRASEASETLSRVTNGNRRYIYLLHRRVKWTNQIAP